MFAKELLKTLFSLFLGLVNLYIQEKNQLIIPRNIKTKLQKDGPTEGRTWRNLRLRKPKNIEL